jgi:hypothetical protein
MKVIFGYDVMTYNGEIPNCLHPKFLNTIYQASDFDYSMSGEHYNKRWNHGWYLYNSNFWNEYADKKSVYEILKYDRDKKWFYIIEPFANLDSFFGNHPLYNEFCLNYISSIALNEIKNGNANLLINYIIDGGEGINKPNFQKIVDFTRGNGIPDEKVYLIFQDFKLKSNLEKMGVKYNIFNFNLAYLSKSQEFNNVIDNPGWKYWGEKSHEPQIGGNIETQQASIASYEEFEQSITSDKVDFLFLCRHWKLHRLMILSKLHKLGNLFNNNTSWDNKFYNQNVIDEFLRHDDNKELAEILKSTPKYVDINDLTKIAGYGFENKDIYLSSYISIVSESMFFQRREDGDVYVEFPTGYLSEKIWKPIGHCQPFILAGPAHSLKYIRSLGFKTFAPFIDESYDDETDDFKRMEMILNEIENFTKKSKEEKIEFLNNIKDIVKYNQKTFLEYSSKIMFKRDCLEIIKNLIDKKSLKLI